MNKNHFWTGHILSGDPKLFAKYQRSLASPAAPKSVARRGARAASSTAGAAAAPDPDGLRSATMYVCALQVTRANFKIDSNDPKSSLAASIDWNNAASQQASILAVYVNQEAPAIAASDASQYNLVWASVSAGDLTGCPTVGDVIALIQKHYS
ncbi:MAG TPA: hypothetical protein VK743_22500 [Steroidobacteraceae bacterium]|jgi:hypothetical protein|nr:hypothetical protein [Steroidobacteraceae bacterium]